MENSVKITIIHLVAAIITGFICSFFSLGMIPGIGKNEIFAGILGIIILYLMGRLSDKLFGKQKGFTAWLWDGIVPFIFIWYVTWAILINYASIIY